MKQQQFVQRSVVQSAFLLFCISGLCGCSLIGFGIGALIDGGKPDKDIVQVGAVMNLKAGDEIRISLVDSTVIEGTYKELALLDSATYAWRYARFLDSVREDITFPKLGDTLFVHTKTSKLQSRYLFRGYGIGYLKLQWLDKPINTNAPFTLLTALENRDGKMLDLGLLERMSKAGQLPRDVSLVVQSTLGTSRVPLDDIEHIEKSTSKNARWIGLAMGLAVDVLVVVASSSAIGDIRWVK